MLVRVGNDVVMSGRVDVVQRRVSRQQVSLSLSGRDGAAVLVDCASPVFTSRQLSLEEVIAQVVRPLGITNIRIEAESSLRNDKVSVEPGERAWDTLERAAAARGLWPWFEPDGTLVIGGPDYTKDPVATLVLNRDGRGNNVLDLSDRSSITGAFSELTMLAQGHGQGKSPGSWKLLTLMTRALSLKTMMMPTQFMTAPALQRMAFMAYVVPFATVPYLSIVRRLWLPVMLIIRRRLIIARERPWLTPV